MSKRKSKKSVVDTPNKPYIGSFEEAVEKLHEFINVERYRNDPYADDVKAEELLPFLKDIWEAAYDLGRKDAATLPDWNNW